MAFRKKDIGRHRPPPEAVPAQAAPDVELESYLKALSPDGDPEVTDPGRRFGSAQVYQVRLPAGADEQLRELATFRKTSPASLIHDWVLSRLHNEIYQQQLGSEGLRS
jgi:hypothetical protein